MQNRCTSPRLLPSFIRPLTSLLKFGFHGGIFALGFLKAMHHSDRLVLGFVFPGASTLFNAIFRCEALRSAIIRIFFGFNPAALLCPALKGQASWFPFQLL